MTDLPHACAGLARAIGEANLHLRYIPRYREYAMDYSDRDARQVLAFCPFCGARLPEPTRQQWFEQVRSLGLEPEDPRVPERFQTDQWWRDAGL